MTHTPTFFVDRLSGNLEQEAIYWETGLRFLYGSSFLARWLRHAFTDSPLLSQWVGWLQNTRLSARQIEPFIKKYHIHIEEFLDPVFAFKSFNDFFIRKLKLESRPQHADPMICPADGRYRVIPRLHPEQDFLIKGSRFSLSHFLQNPKLEKKYRYGSLLLARLCPTDYHRFHFPCDGTPSTTHAIPGHYYSVHPLSLYQDPNRLTKNKRCWTEIQTPQFGDLLFCEIGATHVGSIHQTFQPHIFYQKGVEKGFFSFGGSALLLLFEPGSIDFAPDLVLNSTKGLETRCFWGQSLLHSMLLPYSGE